MRPDVRLWRIAHPDDDIGPFQSKDVYGYDRPHLSKTWDVSDDSYRLDTHPDNMPLPEFTPVLRQGDLPPHRREGGTPRYKFAFPTRELLVHYMPGWALQELTLKGYLVMVVRVPWEAHTRWEVQARYDKARSTIVRTMAPVDALWA